MSRSAAHEQRNDAFREVFLKPFDFAAAAPPTGTQITEVARKLGIDHVVSQTHDGADAPTIHWLGDRNARKVLLYFHGGGFCLPILEGHVKFLNDTRERLAKQGCVVRIAVLEYALSPVHKYPVQILQGVEALEYVFSSGYSPSDVVIGGDSAGGNLTLAVLSVLLHGFEGTEAPKLDRQLAGVLLVCPWVSFEDNTTSWKRNTGRDVIGSECLHLLTEAYVDSANFNNYTEPIRAQAAWWKQLPAQTILNVYGGYECFRDHASELGHVLQEAGNKIENVECEGHVHIDCILDTQTGMEPGKMAQTIWDWLPRAFADE